MSELTYFEVVTLWATMATDLEMKHELESSINSPSYSERVREAEVIVAKLAELKNAKWREFAH